MTLDLEHMLVNRSIQTGCVASKNLYNRDAINLTLARPVWIDHNFSTMFCLTCALSRNRSLWDGKPAEHLFVWFAKHCLAKHCLSFRGDADECEKQYRFVFRICFAFDVRLRWALACEKHYSIRCGLILYSISFLRIVYFYCISFSYPHRIFEIYQQNTHSNSTSILNSHSSTRIINFMCIFRIFSC